MTEKLESGYRKAIDSLSEKLRHTRDCYIECKKGNAKWASLYHTQAAKLKAKELENEKLVEALKFYADISNNNEYVCLNGARDSDFGGINLDDFSFVKLENSYHTKKYGKMAREVLKKLDYE